MELIEEMRCARKALATNLEFTAPDIGGDNMFLGTQCSYYILTRTSGLFASFCFSRAF
jgi:hypothetical protein